MLVQASPASRREVGRLYVNAISMQRPIPDIAEFAKLLRRQRSGFVGIACININNALASFAGLPLVAEHVLEEADGEVGHGMPRRQIPARSVDKDRSFKQVIIDGLDAGNCLCGHANGRPFGQ